MKKIGNVNLNLWKASSPRLTALSPQVQLSIPRRDSSNESLLAAMSRLQMLWEDGYTSVKIWTISRMTSTELCSTREDGYCKKEPCRVELSTLVPITPIGNVGEESVVRI